MVDDTPDDGSHLVRLEPIYSESDQRAVDEAKRSIRELEKRFIKAIEPYGKKIAEINMLYAPRWMIVPALKGERPEGIEEQVRKAMQERKADG